MTKRSRPLSEQDEAWPAALQRLEGYEVDAEEISEEEVVALSWGGGSCELEPKPIARSRKLTFSHMATASRHSAAVSACGQLYLWGECPIESKRQAIFRELGRTAVYQYPTPADVQNLRIVKVAVTRTESYGLESYSGHERCYALIKRLRSLGCSRHAATVREHIAKERRRHKGRVITLGKKEPILILPQLTRVKSLAAGGAHCLALTENGFVYTWGSGRDGKLGLADYHDQCQPVRLQLAAPATLIAAGQSHSAAVLNSDTLYTWGRAARGRLGNGRHLNKNTPQCIKAFTSKKFLALALGGAHSLALLQNGQLYAWGAGGCGQLGIEAFADSPTPALVKLPKWVEATRIAAGKSHSLCLTRAGRIYVWGKNARGELGTGDKRFRVAPFELALPKFHFTHIAAAESQTLALALVASSSKKKNTASTKSLLSALTQKNDKEQIFRCQCARLSSLPSNTKTFRCATCGYSRVCSRCAKRCHRGHKLLLRADEDKDFLNAWCDCGLSPTCTLLTTVDEGPVENMKAAVSLSTIQGRARIWLALHRVKIRKEELAAINLNNAKRVWQTQVLDTVWSKVFSINNAKHISYELECMSVADTESLAARRYLQFQLTLQSLDIQLHMIKRLCACSGAPDPHPKATSTLLRFRSISALRQWHRRHPRHERRSAAYIARWGQMHGLSSVADTRLDAGVISDPDVSRLIELARFSSVAQVDEEAAKPLRRRHSLAAPQGLFRRLHSLASKQRQQLRVKRRLSLEPKARADKSISTMRSAAERAHDENDAEITELYQNGVYDSLDVARRHLLNTNILQWEATRDDEELSSVQRLLATLEPFSTLFHRPSLAPPPLDIRPHAKREKPVRSVSIAAPERIALHTTLWMRHAAFTRAQQKRPTKFRTTFSMKHRGGTIYHRERVTTFCNSDDGAGTPSNTYLDPDLKASSPQSLDLHQWRRQAQILDDSAPKLPILLPSASISTTVPTREVQNCIAHDDTLESQQEDFVYDDQGQPWRPCYDDQGNRYYYCEWTGESNWYPYSVAAAHDYDATTRHNDGNGDYDYYYKETAEEEDNGGSDFHHQQSTMSGITVDSSHVTAGQEPLHYSTTTTLKPSSSTSTTRKKKIKRKKKAEDKSASLSLL